MPRFIRWSSISDILFTLIQCQRYSWPICGASKIKKKIKNKDNKKQPNLFNVYNLINMFPVFLPWPSAFFVYPPCLDKIPFYSWMRLLNTEKKSLCLYFIFQIPYNIFLGFIPLNKIRSHNYYYYLYLSDICVLYNLYSKCLDIFTIRILSTLEFLYLN